PWVSQPRASIPWVQASQILSKSLLLPPVRFFGARLEAGYATAEKQVPTSGIIRLQQPSLPLLPPRALRPANGDVRPMRRPVPYAQAPRFRALHPPRPAHRRSRCAAAQPGRLAQVFALPPPHGPPRYRECATRGLGA